MRRYCLIFILIFALFLTACTPKAAKEETTDAEKTTSEQTVDQKNDTSAKVTEDTTEKEQTTDNISTTKPEASSDTTAKPAVQQTTKQTTSDKAVLHVYGEGVKQECWFSMAQLKAISDGYVEAEYYYRGKDPDKGHSLCKGVRLSYLLDSIVGLTDDAKKVTINASDGYGASYSLAAVRKTYIDETDSTAKLYMILAWFYDGQASDSLCLVMGQNVAGEYNRTYWVKDVISIEVKTQ